MARKSKDADMKDAVAMLCREESACGMGQSPSSALMKDAHTMPKREDSVSVMEQRWYAIMKGVQSLS